MPNRRKSEDFLNVLSFCIDRINSGERAEDCLKKYPEYSEDLRPMLEVVIAVKSCIDSSGQIPEIKTRIRKSLEVAAAAINCGL